MCQESFCLLRLYYIFIETYFITKNSFIVIPNWIWILQTTCLSQPNQKFSKKSIRHYNLLTEFWYGTQESHQTLALIADRNSFFLSYHFYPQLLHVRSRESITPACAQHYMWHSFTNRLICFSGIQKKILLLIGSFHSLLQ